MEQKQLTLKQAVAKVARLEQELRDARAARDRVLVERAAAGESLRSLAAEAGVTHEAVRKIVAAAQPPEDGMLTVYEAAKRSGLPMEVFLQRVGDGDIPITRGAHGARFRLEDIAKL